MAMKITREFVLITSMLVVSVVSTGDLAADDFNYMEIANMNAIAAQNIAAVTALNSSLDEQARRAAKQDNSSSADVELPQRNLLFRRDPKIAREINTGMAKALANKTGIDPEKLIMQFNSGDLQQSFRKLLVKSGFNPDDLADVMAAYWIGAWEIVHGTEPSPAAIKAARSQLRGMFIESKSMHDLSNADKQRAAETFGNLLVLGFTSYLPLKDGSKPDQLADLQETYQQLSIQQGFDLRRFNLTHQGLVPN